MGMRLTILDNNDNMLYYGTKLYGYESRPLVSMRWLYYNKVCTSDDFDPIGFTCYQDFVDYFDYMTSIPKFVELSYSEATTFIDLYIKDFKKCTGLDIEIAIPYRDTVWLEWG